MEFACQVSVLEDLVVFGLDFWVTEAIGSVVAGAAGIGYLLYRYLRYGREK